MNHAPRMPVASRGNHAERWSSHRLAVLPTVAATAGGKLAVTWDSLKSQNRGGEARATVNTAVSDDDGLTWTIRPLCDPPAVWFRRDYSRLRDGCYTTLRLREVLVLLTGALICAARTVGRSIR
jgi:hypothetical protein